MIAGTSVVIIAKRNTGKTVIANYLVKRYKAMNIYKHIFLYSNTADITNDWRSTVTKPKNIIRGFNEQHIRRIIDSQRIKLQKAGCDKSKVPPVLLILDDIIGPETANNSTLNELYTRGRHFNIGILLIAQYAKGTISPTIRQNIDILLFSINNTENLDIIKSITMTRTKNKHMFYEIVEQNTNDYNFILFDQTGRNGCHGCLYRIRATI